MHVCRGSGVVLALLTEGLGEENLLAVHDDLRLRNGNAVHGDRGLRGDVQGSGEPLSDLRDREAGEVLPRQTARAADDGVGTSGSH